MLWLDTEAAPQIEHVVRNFERSAGLKYNAATEDTGAGSFQLNQDLLTLIGFIAMMTRSSNVLLKVFNGHGDDVISDTLYALSSFAEPLDRWFRESRLANILWKFCSFMHLISLPMMFATKISLPYLTTA